MERTGPDGTSFHFLVQNKAGKLGIGSVVSEGIQLPMGGWDFMRGWDAHQKRLFHTAAFLLRIRQD